MLALVAAPARPGGIELREVAEPAPGPDEAIVAVDAVSLNGVASVTVTCGGAPGTTNPVTLTVEAGARVVFGSNGNPPNSVVFTGNAFCAQTFNSVSDVCPSLGCTAP